MPGAGTHIRPATPQDAELIAKLVNQAGEGMPLWVWKSMAATGQSPWDVGRARAAGETSGISWRKAWIAEADGQAAACLIAEEKPDAPQPLDDDAPPLFRPLAELENLALSTGYIYSVSTLPEFQGRGLGSRLVQFAERYAGRNGMSLIVADNNTGARRLYERMGYRETARRRIVKNGWTCDGMDWVLMIRPAGD